jgi:outer membrane biosynthesis protein TonB
MWRKTAVRRLAQSGELPMQSEMVDLMAHEYGDAPDPSDETIGMFADALSDEIVEDAEVVEEEKPADKPAAKPAEKPAAVEGRGLKKEAAKPPMKEEAPKEEAPKQQEAPKQEARKLSDEAEILIGNMVSALGDATEPAHVDAIVEMFGPDVERTTAADPAFKPELDEHIAAFKEKLGGG